MKYEYVLTPEEYDEVKNHRYVSFNCRRCGLLATHYTDSRRREKGRRLLCTKCSAYITNMEKYGVDNPAKADSVKEKARQTNILRYGVEWTGQDPTIRAKQIETNIERYGSACVFGSKEIQQRVEETMKAKYGVSHYIQTKEFQDKADKTNLERWGNIRPQRNEIVKKKIEQTNIERYGAKVPLLNKEIQAKLVEYFRDKFGVDNPLQSKEVKEKVKATNKERYGAEWVVQSQYFIDIVGKVSKPERKPFGSYTYNNLRFDSSWELAYYIYCTDMNYNIERSPKPIEYTYNNELHKYYPDFRVNGEIVEIKGDHFFDKNGNLINPYDSNKNGLYAAKYECMKEHRVKILKSLDIIPILGYVCNIYGKDYLNSFRGTI